MGTVDNPAASVLAASDDALLASLRAGDDAAFTAVVNAYAPAMLRVARLYVRSRAVAEEIVQETWLRVLQSLDGFEGRASFRTWVFVILGNCARRRAQHEGRSAPLAALGPEDEARFFPSDHPRWAGMWTTLVPNWDEVPEEALLDGELRQKLTEAIEALPPNYATVFTLRDIEGWDGSEVCALLGISAENQRVLLHRARARLRTALEAYLPGERA